MADSESLNLECLLRHSDWLTSLARRLVAPSRADDLVQDTWLAALRNPPHGIGSPRAWLTGVARRLARPRRTSNGIDPTLASIEEEAPATDEVVARIEQERLLARLVLELDEPYRSVLLHRFYSGLTSARISRIQGIPPATVRTHLRRALALLRERLEREHGCDRRGWPLASLFLLPHSDTLLSFGKGALLMGTKTTVSISVASGVLCSLVMTEAVLPRLEEQTLADSTQAAVIEREPSRSASTRSPSRAESVPPDSGFAVDEPSPRQPIESPAADTVSLEDLRDLMLSSDRIEQVRAIQALVADGSAKAYQMLLDAFCSTSDRVLLALLGEALLDPSLSFAPEVLDAYFACQDPVMLERLSGLLAQLARSRPDLKSEVVESFVEALDDAEHSPARASAAIEALAALGINAVDELASYLVDDRSGPAGVGSASWLLAQLPEHHGEVVREKLFESLQGSLETLNNVSLTEEERDAVLKKTGSLAWSASLRPEEEHDALAEVLLETLLSTHDPSQAGSLSWGISNLKGLSEQSRIASTRSLLDALQDQTDVSLQQQYFRTIQQLAAAQPSGPTLDELARLIQEARTLQGDGPLAAALDKLLAELQARQ